MSNTSWQLKTPIPAIVFDCDGTLTTLEGIDELAKNNGVGDVVQALTAEAMGKTGISSVLYRKRLELVRPRHEQVMALGELYCSHLVPDVRAVVQILRRFHKSIYLLSAGLLPAIRMLGELLQIPRANIVAVDIQFDEQGNYANYDDASPLVDNQGKRTIITQLKKQHPELIMVGDGLNDYAAHDLVSRFIGFGGVYCRENIAELCQFYIRTASMAPILPLALTKAETQIMMPSEKTLYAKGFDSYFNPVKKTRDYPQ